MQGASQVRIRSRTSAWLKSVALGLLDLAYPRHCAVCRGGVGSEGVSLCWDCRTDMPLIEDPFCTLCGDPVDGMILHEFRCSFCRTHTVHFDRARSAGRYRGKLRTALQSFKYDRNTSLAPDLAAYLLAALRIHFSDCALDVVTYVPLYPRRERQRGFNQSRLLAHCVARELDGARVAGVLRRTRDTGTQTHLSAPARRVNVRDAFACKDPAWVRGRRFLLIDDVMTTGATGDACSRVLKEAGAAAVCVATVARG